MKRVVVFLGMLAIGAVLFLQYAPTKSAVSITGARAAPMGGSGTMFMVTMTLQNDGDAVALSNVLPPDGAEITIMNPDDGGPLILPAGDQAQLAMDGAHLMIRLSGTDFAPGTFQTVTLAFDDGSKVAARVLYPNAAGDNMMDHGIGQGVTVSPAPTVTFADAPVISVNGISARLNLENFDFVRVGDDAAHVPNQGHGHIYLNGLKLRRLYEEDFQIGALAPGDYVLRVALNSNDHRPYLVDATPVDAIVHFQVPG